MSETQIEIKSAGPAGVHRTDEKPVSRVRTAVKVYFPRFMAAEYLEDCADLLTAQHAIADPESADRIPWEQVKKQLGL